MSEALVWQLIRDNNSFLVKRGRTRRDGSIQLSSEPGNLLRVNSFKYSGLANANSLSINASGNTIELSKKTGKDTNKPSKSATTTTLRFNKINSHKVLGELASSGYRSDLVTAAKERYSKLYRSIRVKRGVIKGSKVHRPRGTY